MPNVAEYVAKDDITPDEKGTQAALIAGRRLGEFGRQIAGDVRQIGADIQQHQTAMWASQFYTVASKHENDQTTATDAFINDPEHKAIVMAGASVPAIMQNYDEWAQPLIDNAPTPEAKAHAAEYLARSRVETFRYAAAAESRANGRYIDENDDQTTNNRAASVLANPTPENITQQIELQRQMHDPAHGGVPLPPNMSPDEVDRIKAKDDLGVSRIVEAGYEGMLQSVRNGYAIAAPGSPAEMQAQQTEAKVRQRISAQENFDLLPPEAQGRLSGAVDEAVRQGREQYKSAETNAQKAQDDEGRAVHAQLAVAVTQARAAGKAVPQDIQQQIYGAAQKYPRLAGEFDSLLNAIPEAQRDAESGRNVASDPQTEDAFNKRVLIPAGRPGALTVPEIIQAQNDKRISPEVGSRLLSQQEKLNKDPDLRQGYKDLDHFLSTAIKPQLTKSSAQGLLGPTVDLQGDVAYQEAVREAHQIFEGWLKAGKTPAEAVEIMSNPANNRSFYQRLPYFKNAAGSPDATVYFQQHQYPSTLAPGQTLQPTAAAPSGGVQARQPGESPEAYLKRVGG